MKVQNICSSCGNKHTPGADFCTACGSPVLRNTSGLLVSVDPADSNKRVTYSRAPGQASYASAGFHPEQEAASQLSALEDSNASVDSGIKTEAAAVALWHRFMRPNAFKKLKQALLLVALFIVVFAGIIYALVYFQSGGSNWLPTSPTPHRR